MKEPVDHILRPALPWRAGAGITECGYDATKVKTITRTEHAQRVKDYGRQRGAAKTLEINERTMRKYVSGDSKVPKTVELALLYLASQSSGETKS